MKKALKFISEAKKAGYKMSGSVLKVDFNGEVFTVGFWIRPQNLITTGQYTGEYQLKGLCGKAKDKNLDRAIEKAILKAKGL